MNYFLIWYIWLSCAIVLHSHSCLFLLNCFPRITRLFLNVWLPWTSPMIYWTFLWKATTLEKLRFHRHVVLGKSNDIFCEVMLCVWRDASSQTEVKEERNSEPIIILHQLWIIRVYYNSELWFSFLSLAHPNIMKSWIKQSFPRFCKLSNKWLTWDSILIKVMMKLWIVCFSNS